MNDRYEVLETLYRSATSRTYLVRHKSLDEKRIIKVIESRGLYEAKVLKDLRHPGIPILYDIIEDEDTTTLVEEYIQGQSLSEYILCHTITPDKIIKIAIEVCEILSYLHSLKPYPLLHLDLKPEHMICCGDSIRLIDYDIAKYLNGREDTFSERATVKYAAPEQLAGLPVDTRTDLYSLGIVLQELADHSSEEIPGRLKKTIKWAIKEDPDERPPSAKAWQEAFKDLQLRKEKSIGEGALYKTIAVLGNKRSVGTTHIALSLTVHLNRSGQEAYYVDYSEGKVTEGLMHNSPVLRSDGNIIYHHYFRSRKINGPGIDICDEHREGIEVWDVGTDADLAVDADRIIYVIGSRLWQERNIETGLISDPAVSIIINPASGNMGKMLAAMVKKRVLGFPLDSDPFLMTEEKQRLFTHILAEEKGKSWACLLREKLLVYMRRKR